jgi:sugar lactone lactonase YvrE
MNAQLVYDAKAILGEGPGWDAEGGELMWVDIEKGELHFFNPSAGTDRKIDLGARVGMAVPTSDDKILVAMETGLAMLGTDGSLEIFADPEAGMPNNRFNDGKCAPDGRLWVGSMDSRREDHVLYRYAHRGRYCL